MEAHDLLAALKNGALDQRLTTLYAPGGDGTALSLARARASYVVESFLSQFGDAQSAALFSGPGRTELGGNHTDHQHGNVLCGSVNMDTLACAAPNGRNIVRVVSEGYPPIEISLDSLLPREEEQNPSAALVRGVTAKLMELGYPLSGFDAYGADDGLGVQSPWSAVCGSAVL